MIRTVLFIAVFFALKGLLAQENAEKYRLMAAKTNEAIELDGKLLEGFWSKAQPADQFMKNFPEDSVLAIDQTVIKLASMITPCISVVYVTRALVKMTSSPH